MVELMYGEKITQWEFEFTWSRINNEVSICSRLDYALTITSGNNEWVSKMSKAEDWVRITQAGRFEIHERSKCSEHKECEVTREGVLMISRQTSNTSWKEANSDGRELR